MDGTRKQTDRVAGREMAAPHPAAFPVALLADTALPPAQTNVPAGFDRTGPAAGPAGPAGWEKQVWQALKGSQAT